MWTLPNSYLTEQFLILKFISNLCFSEANFLGDDDGFYGDDDDDEIKFKQKPKIKVTLLNANIQFLIFNKVLMNG